MATLLSKYELFLKHTKVAILTRPLWQPLVSLINIKEYKNERLEYTIMTKGMGGKLWKIDI